MSVSQQPASRYTIFSRYATAKGDQNNEKENEQGVNLNENDKNPGDIDPPIPTVDEAKERKKSQIGKAAAQIIKRRESEEDQSLLNKLNPFQAGQKLRKSLDSALTSLARASSGSGVSSEDRQRSLYYLDDRFQESGGALFTQETNPYLARLEKENYIPEVLVVGATGEVGRLVVRRLLLEGRSRVRVLVRDLYSKTLNMLGTGVVYCQGDLNNMETLEYALTDVDKIVVCAGAPRPDEDGFQDKFLGFAKDNLESTESIRKINTTPYKKGATKEDETEVDMEWERLSSVLEIRARLAEQVDFIGMQNLVKAYQNVRYADYGTSQAAKRSLFKFQKRPEDFNVFAIDEAETDNAVIEEEPSSSPLASSNEQSEKSFSASNYGDSDSYDEIDEYADEYDKYADKYGAYADFDDYDDDDEYVLGAKTRAVEMRQDASVQTQVRWLRNEFGHGVFVGKVPKSTAAGVGGQASIISSRLRSRVGGPDDGIDLSGGFGGFVCRVCSDGGNYEAFIRNAAYDELGIEYVCEFSTASKVKRRRNASRNKFMTVRLPFEAFRPVSRGAVASEKDTPTIPPFDGKDVRYVGFRYRSSRNAYKTKEEKKGLSSFYLALSYIKLYRIQPEPEFVFLSDARIPPVVLDGQVRHDIHQLVPAEALSSASTGSSGLKLLDEKDLQAVSSDKMARSPEETYYKFRGEQVLKSSGLSYAIVRVAGYNEDPSLDASTIELKSTNYDIQPVSRAEAAQVCVSALLDPCALNKSFYVSKKSSKKSIAGRDESMSEKFKSLDTDASQR